MRDYGSNPKTSLAVRFKTNGFAVVWLLAIWFLAAPVGALAVALHLGRAGFVRINAPTLAKVARWLACLAALAVFALLESLDQFGEQIGR